MKCVNCKNLGKLLDDDGVPYDWCEKVCDNPDVFAERKCKHYVVASHADKIRSMSDEELAEFLDRWEMGDIDYAKTFCNLCDGQYDCHNDCLMGWLREEDET